MHLKLWHIVFLVLLGNRAATQDQQVLLQPGDTLYKSIDLLPQSILISANTPTGFWDFSSLLAPYVHEVYVRPVPAALAADLKADLVMMDVDGTERFAATSEAGISFTAFRTPLDGKNLYMGVCNPAIPWRSSTPALGDNMRYEGTCIFGIAGERHTALGLPPGISDSIRLRVNYQVDSRIDAYGAMVMPGGQHVVLRERKVMNCTSVLERKENGGWVEMTAEPQNLNLPVELRTGTTYTFWSSSYPEPVAVVHANRSGQVSRVEFRSTPYGRRIVSTFPKIPDVFVYPNPSFGEVRFDFVNLEPGEYTLEIYNILGVKLRTYGPVFVEGTRTVAMDLSDLKKGTYIYRLVDRNQTAIRSKRLVIITP